MDFAEYVALFNAGDDQALVETAYAEDCVISMGTQEIRGPKACLELLTWMHDGVREVMRPRRVIELGDDVFAEIDTDFHASKARPDFTFGAMAPGDLITVKFFASYRKRDGRFSEIKLANWPPGQGVTRLPRLGPHPSQIAAFHAYAAAFSAGDIPRFTSFYTEDVVMESGPGMPPLLGKTAIADFYSNVLRIVREKLTIHNLMVSETAVAADLAASFTAVADAPDFYIAPMRKGEVVEVPAALARYSLRDGLISHLAVFPRSEPVKRN